MKFSRAFPPFLLLGLLNALVSASLGQAAEPAPLDRVSKGNGSVVLVSEKIRQMPRLFKSTPQGDLNLYFFLPADWQAGDRRPVIVFFFGGGWHNGTPKQFIPQAEYFATRGIVCALADYRVSTRHKTTPDICVEDAKSAIRWVRTHAGELGVDPKRVVSSGGSAGGHLAAAVTFCPAFDAGDEDLTVSSKPDAMILFNPALNLVARPVLDMAGRRIERDLSPTLFLQSGAPPALLLYGTADSLKPQGDEFCAATRKLGNRCDYYTAEEQPHGFFNAQPWNTATVILADRFLASLGYLKGEPTLPPTDAELAAR